MDTKPDSPRAGWRGRLETVFGADLRSLALFRIAVATVLLGDVVNRSRNLAAHYTDLGVHPASQALNLTGKPIYLSLHYHLSGSVPAEWALFAIHALFAIALLVGFHTRIASIASWYLLASLQLRNPYLSALGGDTFLRLMLFWAMFLPLGARFSIDALRSRGASFSRSSNWLFSVPTAALLAQIALMYVATGLHKSGEDWVDGTALTFALNLDQFQTALTPWLREARGLHAPLTYFTRYFEIFGPLIAFVPVWNGGFRLLAFVLFTGFHLSLAAFLDIGPFPFMCIASWFAFLPSELWDEGLARLGGRRAASPEPAAPGYATPLLLQLVAGAALAWILLHVGATLAGRTLPEPVRMPGVALRINQMWTMFAPNPAHDDVWLIADGQLADGRRVNPFSGGDVSIEKPSHIPATARNFRWRLYTWYALLGRSRTPYFQERHRLFAEYLCREWNREHWGGERLVKLRTIRMHELTRLEGSAAPVPHLLNEHDCEGATLSQR